MLNNVFASQRSRVNQRIALFYFVISHRSLRSGTRESVAHASSQLCRPCVKERLCILLYLEVIIQIPFERD